jgi:hypothetical protein
VPICFYTSSTCQNEIKHTISPFPFAVEAQLHVSGYINRQKRRIWSTEFLMLSTKDHCTPENLAYNVVTIVGFIFFREREISEHYQKLIMNFITSLLEVAEQDVGFDKLWLLKIVQIQHH